MLPETNRALHAYMKIYLYFIFLRHSLQSLDQPDMETLIEGGDLEGEDTIIAGVVTHIINDAGNQVFDDTPCI